MADIRKLINTGPNSDSLRSAFPIVNQVIDNTNEALTKATTAETNSINAVNTANESNTKSDSTQAQLDTIVIESGTSDAETLQARTNADAVTFNTLQARLNNSDALLAEREQEIKEIKKQGILLNDYSDLVDVNGYWNAAISQAMTDAVAQKKPIIPVGRYKIFADGADAAITLQNNVQFVSPFWVYHGQANSAFMSGVFEFHGTGDAFRLPDTGSGYVGVKLQNILIVDQNGTGRRGIDFSFFTSSQMFDVTTVGFDEGMYFGGGIWYSDLLRLKAKNSRTKGITFTGGVNHTTIDLGIMSTSTIMTTGLSIGYDGSYAYSNGFNLKATIEVHSGTPARLYRSYGIKADIYCEHGGVASDYGSSSVVASECKGGEIKLNLYGKNVMQRGIYLLNSYNIDLIGNITEYTTYTYILAAGCKAINTSGLHVDDLSKITGTSFTSGRMIGEKYQTIGTAAPTTGTWNAGDTVINKSPVASGYAGWICTAAGAPGTWKGYGAIEA